MWDELRKMLIIAEAVIILLIGGCDSFTKSDYAADARFVLCAPDKTDSC